MELVSVIIPCYNHGRYLSEAISSVLQQTHSNVEVIVVDDCSTDDSAQLATEFAYRDQRVRLLKNHSNQGLSATRNHGMRHVRGDWIAFCDADDIWLRNKLQRQLATLREAPFADIIYSDSEIINADGIRTGERFSDLFPLPAAPSGWLFLELCLRNFINIQTAIIRTNSIGNNSFDPNVALVNDWLLWIRLARFHRFHYLDSITAQYRIHPHSTNLMQARQYEINRFKVYRWTLKNCGYLPQPLRSSLWYHMGVTLQRMNRRRQAKHCFQVSLQMGLTYPGCAGQNARALARLASG